MYREDETWEQYRIRQKKESERNRKIIKVAASFIMSLITLAVIIHCVELYEERESSETTTEKE